MFKFLALFGFSLQHGFSLFNVGSAIGIGASLIGGLGGSKAAKGAASSQSASASQAIEEIRKIGDRTRSDTYEYRNLGGSSVRKLSDLLGFDTETSGYADASGKVKSLTDQLKEMDAAGGYGFGGGKKGAYKYYAERAKIQNQLNAAQSELGSMQKYQDKTEDTGSLLRSFAQKDLDEDVVYNTGLKFGLDEGNKAIERNATRFGNLDSGATLKALARYGNDYGNQRAGDAYGRFMVDKDFTLKSLLGTTRVGQDSISLDANTGAQMASAIGNAQMAQGNANAAGQIGSANAWSGALGGIANTLGGASRGGSFNFGSIFGGGGGNRTAAYPGAYYA
jgi:hypothetical protein